jgi:predicted house-cleaning NTP pyrophosphatase (Maf/HAM1 superfamily)
VKTIEDAIQKYGEGIVERMEGSDNNAMGFPTERLQGTLEQLGML